MFITTVVCFDIVVVALVLDGEAASEGGRTGAAK